MIVFRFTFKIKTHFNQKKGLKIVQTIARQESAESTFVIFLISAPW